MSLRIESVDARALRANLFSLYQDGDIDADQISTFATHAEEFKDTEGVADVLNDVGSSDRLDDYRGTANHLKLSSTLQKQGSDIVEFERTVVIDGVGETRIDIVTARGDLIESKSRGYAYVEANDRKYYRLSEQLSKY